MLLLTFLHGMFGKRCTKLWLVEFFGICHGIFRTLYGCPFKTIEGGKILILKLRIIFIIANRLATNGVNFCTALMGWHISRHRKIASGSVARSGDLSQIRRLFVALIEAEFDMYRIFFTPYVKDNLTTQNGIIPPKIESLTKIRKR